MDDASSSSHTNPNFRLSSDDEPPVYRIDLSLPPRLRHHEICRHYKAELAQLIPLFSEVLESTPFPRFLKFMAKLALRGVYSTEECEEIRGIADATGIAHHFVVAYNTFLDLFSGCTSGGVKVNDAGNRCDAEGIVHFRGLDWNMEPLRKLTICVEYVRNGYVIARAVTYAGFTGVLTGVRKDLSISLNYRINIGSSYPAYAHRLHQLRLLLGYRPSIASHLRTILLSTGPAPTLAYVKECISKLTTSPCYLTFCSTSSILILEKDLKAAKSESSDDFLAVTNHDSGFDLVKPEVWKDMLRKGFPELLHNFLGGSMERKQLINELWKQSSSATRTVDVKRWLGTDPLKNPSTHFSCIMDPAVDGGGLVWVQRFMESYVYVLG